MIENLKIACVIPCYKERNHILDVLKKIPDIVDFIFVVDDNCPEKTGEIVLEKNEDLRVNVIFMEKNLGVGGATVAGYKEAIKYNADIVVKIDGDGQMDPLDLKKVITPIVSKKCDYTKGNRFFFVNDIKSMPKVRIFGNICLTFFSKFSSGFWEISDPTNGYTAIHQVALKSLDLDKISRGYFFESDILCKLYLIRAKVLDVPIPANYRNEESGINIIKIIPLFLRLHTYNFFKRIIAVYFLRDFHFYSLNLFIGIILFGFGIIFGLIHYTMSLTLGITASAGTVMLSALPIFTGFISLMQFMSFDIKNSPKFPLQLNKVDEADEDF